MFYKYLHGSLAENKSVFSTNGAKNLTLLQRQQEQNVQSNQKISPARLRNAFSKNNTANLCPPNDHASSTV